MHFQNLFPIEKALREETAREAPTAKKGIPYLMNKLYSEEFIHLHRKTAAKVKNGPDLTIPMDAGELQNIRSKYLT